MPRRADTTHDDAIRRMHAEGKGWTAIARKLGAAPCKICRAAHRLGLKIDRTRYDDTILRMHAEGKRWAEIGDAIGVSRQHAYRLGRNLGIAMRADVARANLVAGILRQWGLDRLTPAQLADYRTLRRSGYSRPESLDALGIADPLIQNPERDAVTSRPRAGRAAHPPRAGATSPGGRGQSPAGGFLT
jgi:DNA-binding CsgD family transcriptional regulator